MSLNAETLYKKGIQRPAMLIDASWTQKPAPSTAIDCTTQLSGLMLIEIAADLKAKGRW